MSTAKRTDLAMEAREILRESAGKTTEIEGVVAREYKRRGCPVTRVEVKNEMGQEALGKPVGTYVTVEMQGLMRHEEDAFKRSVRAIAEELTPLLPVGGMYGVLLAGLGNREITPDAIGPLAMRDCVVTRHLVDKLPEEFGHMRPVSAIAPGVLGTTGMESAEVISGVIDHIRPGAVIIVDALTSRRLSRLCSTVQLADSGIVPGSGVGNARAALNRATLGVPVISVGVPTVVDAVTLMADLTEQAGQPNLDWKEISKFSGGLMVTPKEIDTQVKSLAKVIGYALSVALHPEMSIEDVQGFLGS
ncbi:MAG: GPR endopeptidase [Oscillospiraceae bacterium]|jgi:spore protease|nr:GPR endopeptidase [Oscillospiraceae bacterium]